MLASLPPRRPAHGRNNALRDIAVAVDVLGRAMAVAVGVVTAVGATVEVAVPVEVDAGSAVIVPVPPAPRHTPPTHVPSTTTLSARSGSAAPPHTHGAPIAAPSSHTAGPM